MPGVRRRPNVRAVPRSQLDDRDDAALLAAHVGGDREAFGELFARHRPGLYRLARHRSATAEDADDAVQDAMLAAHRAASSFRNDAAVSSWLYRILVNTCTDRWRRNAISPTVPLTDDTVAIGDQSGRVETTLVVRQALLRLPAEQRAVTLAIDLQGYTIADTARLLGVPEGTVKSRCARARGRLAVLLHPLRPA